MRFLVVLVPLFMLSCKVEVVNRYNYVQRPTDKSVTIAWRSESDNIGKLAWGVDPKALNHELTDTVATKKHAFDINDLNPNTKYYYQTTASINGQVRIDSFYTAKRRNADKFSFLHYGDCGTGAAVQDSIALLMSQQKNIDFGLVAGDVDQGKGNKYDEIFFEKYADMLSHSCHYTAIGNHDGYYYKAKTYLDAFYLPENGEEGSLERYYSFTWGDAKFICLDSNYGLGVPRKEGVKSEKQEKWLARERATEPLYPHSK